MADATVRTQPSTSLLQKVQGNPNVGRVRIQRALNSPNLKEVYNSLDVLLDAFTMGLLTKVGADMDGILRTVYRGISDNLVEMLTDEQNTELIKQLFESKYRDLSAELYPENKPDSKVSDPNTTVTSKVMAPRIQRQIATGDINRFSYNISDIMDGFVEQINSLLTTLQGLQHQKRTAGAVQPAPALNHRSETKSAAPLPADNLPTEALDDGEPQSESNSNTVVEEIVDLSDYDYNEKDFFTDDVKTDDVNTDKALTEIVAGKITEIQNELHECFTKILDKVKEEYDKKLEEANKRIQQLSSSKLESKTQGTKRFSISETAKKLQTTTTRRSQSVEALAKVKAKATDAAAAKISSAHKPLSILRTTSNQQSSKKAVSTEDLALFKIDAITTLQTLAYSFRSPKFFKLSGIAKRVIDKVLRIAERSVLKTAEEASNEGDKASKMTDVKNGKKLLGVAGKIVGGIGSAILGIIPYLIPIVAPLMIVAFFRSNAFKNQFVSQGAPGEKQKGPVILGIQFPSFGLIKNYAVGIWTWAKFNIGRFGRAIKRFVRKTVRFFKEGKFRELLKFLKSSVIKIGAAWLLGKALDLTMFIANMLIPGGWVGLLISVAIGVLFAAIADIFGNVLDFIDQRETLKATAQANPKSPEDILKNLKSASEGVDVLVKARKIPGLEEAKTSSGTVAKPAGVITTKPIFLAENFRFGGDEKKREQDTNAFKAGASTKRTSKYLDSHLAESVSSWTAHLDVAGISKKERNRNKLDMRDNYVAPLIQSYQEYCDHLMSVVKSTNATLAGQPLLMDDGNWNIRYMIMGENLTTKIPSDFLGQLLTDKVFVFGRLDKDHIDSDRPFLWLAGPNAVPVYFSPGEFKLHWARAVMSLYQQLYADLGDERILTTKDFWNKYIDQYAELANPFNSIYDSINLESLILGVERLREQRGREFVGSTLNTAESLMTGKGRKRLRWVANQTDEVKQLEALESTATSPSSTEKKPSKETKLVSQFEDPLKWLRENIPNYAVFSAVLDVITNRSKATNITALQHILSSYYGEDPILANADSSFQNHLVMELLLQYTSKLKLTAEKETLAKNHTALDAFSGLVLYYINGVYKNAVDFATRSLEKLKTATPDAVSRAIPVIRKVFVDALTATNMEGIFRFLDKSLKLKDITLVSVTYANATEAERIQLDAMYAEKARKIKEEAEAKAKKLRAAGDEQGAQLEEFRAKVKSEFLENGKLVMSGVDVDGIARGQLAGEEGIKAGVKPTDSIGPAKTVYSLLEEIKQDAIRHHGETVEQIKADIQKAKDELTPETMSTLRNTTLLLTSNLADYMQRVRDIPRGAVVVASGDSSTGGNTLLAANIDDMDIYPEG